MWKCAKLSVRGAAHLVNGSPCQDWTTLATVGKQSDQVVVCAISDGAGSAKYSDEGSHLAAETAIKYFEQQLSADNPYPGTLVSDYDIRDARALASDINCKLTNIAEKRGVSVQDFAATLLVCVIHSENSFFIQIGDGFWCTSVRGVIGLVTWPSRGEFVGETDFVTSIMADEKSEKRIQVSHLVGKPDFVIGISDGLERLAINLQNAIPSDRFFLPLIRKLKMDEAVDFEASLRVFLESDRVCDRTDDDKSIVIVVPNA